MKAGPLEPRFETLDRADARAVLARNAVGRIAFSFRDRVDIQPIHYAFDGEWIFGRTAPGQKLTTLRHSPWVAFEVDEVDGLFEWRSVVVHGGFYTFSEDGSPSEQESWQRAVDALRRVIPEIGTPADPVPERTVIFGIHVDRISGRRATSRPPRRA